MSLMGVMQLDDLDNPLFTKGFDEENPCHIYMIGTRPRISLNPAGTTVNDEEIKLDFKVWQKDEFEPFQFTVPNFYEEKNVKILAEYPYNQIILSLMILNNRLKRASYYLNFCREMVCIQHSST